MEAEYYAARANLRRLMRQHPRWTQPQYAQAVGMSLSWVKKWKKRLEEAGPEDGQVLHSRSRARKHPPERISPTVTDRILQMRDEPPEGLQRTPGPKAILYYLPRDEQLQGELLPRSSRTIYRILQQAGRIAHRLPHLQEPLERPAPMSHWQLDFKDASTVPADPDGKRQHMVEVLNTVDEGTSVLVEAQVGADFRAETTVGAVAQLFVRHGLPEAVRMDRDVRFVSSPSGSDFPSALVRFCQCLGVGVLLCDPRHPQQNDLVAYCTPFVRCGCFLIFVSILLRSMLIGWWEDRHSMIIEPIHGKQPCPSPLHEGVLAHPVGCGSLMSRQQAPLT